MGLFGQTKPRDPKETVREMKKKLRSEQRGIDRSINHIKREELKVSHYFAKLINNITLYESDYVWRIICTVMYCF